MANTSSATLINLVRSAVRVPTNLEETARVVQSIRTDAEWNGLLSEAQRHGCMPLICSHLLSLAGGVPNATKERLFGWFQTHTEENLWLTAELLKIVHLLATEGIVCLPYKGPVLAQSIYGNVALRQFCDLDILVSVKDCPHAKNALVRAGYRPALTLNAAQERAYLRAASEYQFVTPEGAIVELQWQIAAHYFSANFDIFSLLAASTPIKLGGMQVANMSPEDTLLVLCFHGSKHLWERLAWVCDVAGLLRNSAIDWEVVFVRAHHLGLNRILVVGLLLAHRLLDTPLPHKVTVGPAEARLVACFEQNLFHSPSILPLESSVKYFLTVSHLRERWRDKLRFFVRLAVTPGIGEWSTVRLPAALFPLYRIVRLFRLFAKLRLSHVSRT